MARNDIRIEILFEEIDRYKRGGTPLVKWQSETLKKAIRLANGYFRYMNIIQGYESAMLEVDTNLINNKVYRIVMKDHGAFVYSTKSMKDIPIVINGDRTAEKLGCILNCIYRNNGIVDLDREIFGITKSSDSIKAWILYNDIMTKIPESEQVSGRLRWLCIYLASNISSLRGSQIDTATESGVCIIKKYNNKKYVKLNVRDTPNMGKGYYIAAQFIDELNNTSTKRLFNKGTLKEVCIDVNTAMVMFGKNKK